MHPLLSSPVTCEEKPPSCSATSPSRPHPQQRVSRASSNASSPAVLSLALRAATVARGWVARGWVARQVRPLLVAKARTCSISLAVGARSPKLSFTGPLSMLFMKSAMYSYRPAVALCSTCAGAPSSPATTLPNVFGLSSSVGDTGFLGPPEDSNRGAKRRVNPPRGGSCLANRRQTALILPSFADYPTLTLGH